MPQITRRYWRRSATRCCRYLPFPHRSTSPYRTSRRLRVAESASAPRRKCVRYICGGSREDLFGGLCPRERSWVGVPVGDPFADVVFQRDSGRRPARASPDSGSAHRRTPPTIAASRPHSGSTPASPSAAPARSPAHPTGQSYNGSAQQDSTPASVLRPQEVVEQSNRRVAALSCVHCATCRFGSPWEVWSLHQNRRDSILASRWVSGTASRVCASA